MTYKSTAAATTRPVIVKKQQQPPLIKNLLIKRTPFKMLNNKNRNNNFHHPPTPNFQQQQPIQFNHMNFGPNKPQPQPINRSFSLINPSSNQYNPNYYNNINNSSNNFVQNPQPQFNAMFAAATLAANTFRLMIEQQQQQQQHLQNLQNHQYQHTTNRHFRPRLMRHNSNPHYPRPPVDRNHAPYNTTQYIMQDFNKRHPAKGSDQFTEEWMKASENSTNSSLFPSIVAEEASEATHNIKTF